MTRLVVALLIAVLLPRAATAGPSAAFDSRAALAHIWRLAGDIGVRGGGSDAEAEAREYVVGAMTGWGYTVKRQTVPLPHGGRTENLMFDKVGRAPWSFVVGAHLDSKPPSPGANDNASGVATVLEVARALRSTPLAGGVRFAFFGAEERLPDTGPDGHHFGSRWYVAHMTPGERAACAGMICIDSVGAGPWFVIGAMGSHSPLARDLRAVARQRGTPARAQTDPGWSDHEPFERAGFATAYVRWRIDDTLHTPADSAAHVRAEKVAAAGSAVLDFLCRASRPYARKTSAGRRSSHQARERGQP